MEEDLVADRQHLRHLLATRPDWSCQDLADATGRSLSWVKKWKKRLSAAHPDDVMALRSQSRARKTPPPRLSEHVIARILEIRDQPPRGLGRIPGPKAILYYLRQEADTTLAGERLPRSTRTIWLVLRQHQRIVLTPTRTQRSTDRAEPMSAWQIDFKDASTVPSAPEGKKQHMVEVLNTVDTGTSILVNAQPRADFSMATTIAAVAETVQEVGLPDSVTFDRDSRFLGGTHQPDAPSPFVRFWLCLGVQVTILPPRRPDLNAFVERYHRAYDEECLQVYRPADLAAVSTVTATFRQHYNEERPHQGVSCGNQPPRQAFPELPVRPAVPAMVDPDRWVEVLDGQRYVRKVQANTEVNLDTQRYFVSQALVGQKVTLVVRAAERVLVIEHAGKEIKRIPLHGTGHPPCSFEQFVAQLCEEARTGRRGGRPLPRQLALNL
ncbi:MAG TPA: integrase core domain-containing protein [Chloroflexaceae bacterium]|nr:integrase core domain-containing protein [Chloroflexaceae bacterium]